MGSASKEQRGSGQTDDQSAVQSLQRVTEAALAYLDLDDLLSELLDRTTEILDVDTAAILRETGGEGVVVWSEADEDERAEVRRALEDSPEDRIAQRRVQLSCHPTLREGRLRPRRVDLRPYVIRVVGGREVVVPGLSRVALEKGSLIVNSSRGGGVKDTWLVAD
jgi:uncharacterized circularly permuted ATP-grasp superfamily protein